MLDKIQSFFGFTTMPYGRGLTPGMLFPSSDHGQAAARIAYGIATRGITVITGEVGVGKTVAARAAIGRTEPARHHLIYVPDPTIGARGCTTTWSPRWAANPASTTPRWSPKPATPWPPNTQSEDVSPSADRRGPPAHPRRAGSAAAADQPRARHRIPVRDRPTRTAHPGHQDEARHPGRARTTDHRAPPHDRHDQDRGYIRHHLQLAGRADPLFTEDAIELIHTSSRGKPRNINRLAISRADRRLRGRQKPRRRGQRPIRRHREHPRHPTHDTMTR